MDGWWTTCMYGGGATMWLMCPPASELCQMLTWFERTEREEFQTGFLSIPLKSQLCYCGTTLLMSGTRTNCSTLTLNGFRYFSTVVTIIWSMWIFCRKKNSAGYMWRKLIIYVELVFKMSDHHTYPVCTYLVCIWYSMPLVHSWYLQGLGSIAKWRFTIYLHTFQVHAYNIHNWHILGMYLLDRLIHPYPEKAL